MIEFLLKAFELKDEERAGWKLRGIRSPESVADHSWGTALLCWLYAPRSQGSDDSHPIDRERAIAMAQVHDIAEAEMGDVATRVHEEEREISAAEKGKRERSAFYSMLGLIPAGRVTELAELWEEYEAGESATARFVRDMNLCDMCLQALLYQRSARYEPNSESAAFRHFENLDEFFETSRPRISTEIGRALYAEIEARYRTLVDSDTAGA